MGDRPRSGPPPAVVAAIAGALAVFAAETGAPGRVVAFRRLSPAGALGGAGGAGLPGEAAGAPPEEAPAGAPRVTAGSELSPWVLAGRLDAILRRQSHARRGGGGR